MTASTITRAVASDLLYKAELALADARSTGVDEWIRLAADRLHEAVVRYESVAMPPSAA